jgi:NAD(P)-dependent dehydrogenase (short-subunit alcohol dehydrogenase family)
LKTLDGKIAWITGGATGVGRQTAQRLARDGARVAISGRREAELHQAVEQLQADGYDAQAFALDVADAEAVAATADQIAGQMGPVDLLVCSAGLNVRQRYWQDLAAVDFAKVTRVNLEGVANCVVAVLSGMRARRRGTIVVVSSWAGRHYLPFAGAAYNASKQGLAGLVDSLNFENGRYGVRACAIEPGEIATPILLTRPVPPSAEEMARMLTADDVAEAIGWVVGLPPHVCIKEVLLSPTCNRIHVGGEDLHMPI